MTKYNKWSIIYLLNTYIDEVLYLVDNAYISASEGINKMDSSKYQITKIIWEVSRFTESALKMEVFENE